MPSIFDAVKKFDVRAEGFDRIPLQTFQTLLREVNGARFATITVATEPEMRKTNNPFFGNVLKISRINGVINFNYTNSRNNLLEKAGEARDFIAKPRQWGTQLKGMPFISHVTQEGMHRLYLEMKVEKTIGHEYRYKHTGKTLSDDEVVALKSFFPVKRKEEVIVRDFNMSNILAVVLDGKGYLVGEEVEI